MPRLVPRNSRKLGQPPGTLTYMGEPRTHAARITLLAYDAEHLTEQELDHVEECLPFTKQSGVTWVHIEGLHQVEVIEAAGKCFDLHPLTMEDILSISQRPKVEDFGRYLFIVLKALRWDTPRGELQDEEISLVLGGNFVLSFEERQADTFAAVRARLQQNHGRIRKLGPDYLAYSLVDVVVDGYFAVLETLGEEIEAVQEALVAHPSRNSLQKIYGLKRELIFIRKAVWPLREVISRLERGESPLFQGDTLVYLKDVYDHAIQVIDTVETYRDIVSGMLDIYLSSVSNRTNEIMKVLTIISTIFIPLTFIVGVYGMNFDYMPELKWHYGYPAVMGLMAVIAGALLWHFRRKGWI